MAVRSHVNRHQGCPRTLACRMDDCVVHWPLTALGLTL